MVDIAHLKENLMDWSFFKSFTVRKSEGDALCVDQVEQATGSETFEEFSHSLRLNYLHCCFECVLADLLAVHLSHT